MNVSHPYERLAVITIPGVPSILILLSSDGLLSQAKTAYNDNEVVKMKRLTVIGILAVLLAGLVLTGFSCAPQATLDISVTELDNGVMIENAGDVDCIVFVNSPEGEQQFELPVGQNTMVTGISQPIEVSAVSK